MDPVTNLKSQGSEAIQFLSNDVGEIKQNFRQTVLQNQKIENTFDITINTPSIFVCYQNIKISAYQNISSIDNDAENNQPLRIDMKVQDNV